jgi:exodeoxyribonuclease V beta subunit
MPGGERSITNLLQCGELLHSEALSSHLGVDALCIWFSEQVTTPPEGEEHQIRLESDEKAVKILTIHVSKGLEFPIVFCPFLWGGVFDSSDTVVAHEGYDLVADFGSDKFEEHRRAAMDESLAENVRLLYVAVTRAKYRCYVAWGRFRYTESSALAYLFHSPAKAPGSSSYEDLVEIMETISDGNMIAKIQSLVSEGCINLVIDPVEESVTDYSRRTIEADQFNCRTMKTTIESDWGVTSFSSLIDGHESPPEYTVAVSRYLERRIPDYNYDTHFGGVYYLFLRGIDTALSNNGIYFDKPDAALVQELSQCLIDFEEA